LGIGREWKGKLEKDGNVVARDGKGREGKGPCVKGWAPVLF